MKGENKTSRICSTRLKCERRVCGDKAIKVFAIAAAAALMATPALAAVVSGNLTGGTAFMNGGTFQIIAPPAVVGQDNFNNNNVRAFNERQGVTLLSALAVNSGPAIVAGRVVNSHAVNFDPAKGRSVRGTIVFNGPVLGLIWTRARLMATNGLLGAPGTPYRTPGNVGFETKTDSATFSGNTVSFNLTASSPGDTFRVLTAVPGPDTWAMMLIGFGMISMALHRRHEAALAR